MLITQRIKRLKQGDMVKALLRTACPFVMIRCFVLNAVSYFIAKCASL